MFQQHTTLPRDKLNEAEKVPQQKVEILTRDVNELLLVADLKKKKEELETKIHLLAKEKELCSRKKEDAWRRYQEMKKEIKEAESKMKELSDYRWVPCYGIFLVVRELVECNTKKCLDAYEEMLGYIRDMERAETDIALANTAVWEVQL